MMKMIDYPRVLRRMLGGACTAVLAMGCMTEVGDRLPADPVPDAPAMDLDPTGNWNLNYMFDAGCGQPASKSTATFTVTRAASGYAVSAPGITVMGTMICAPDSCKLSGTLAWATSEAKFQQSANLVLDGHGSVTGNGTESVVAGTTLCGLAFTVAGSKI